VKLRAGEEPAPFKVEFTANDQTAAFRFLGSSKAEPTESDTQAELALFAIVQFLEEGGNVPVRAGAIKAHCKTLRYSNRTIERALEMGIEQDIFDKPQWGCYQLIREGRSQ
jgi:hypothetical protein